MNAIRRNLLDDILGKAQQLLIPVYQRQYSWKTDQCQQLWDDVLYAGNPESELHHHFMGSIVCKMNDRRRPITTTIVIDGQQRLTTIVLLLVALADKIEHYNPTVTREKIYNTYLINPYEKDSKHRHKLILSEEDRESLKAVIDGDEMYELSLNINGNFSWFKSKMDKLKEEEYKYLWEGLRHLSIIEMTLDGDDNPQRIFETMNSTGLDLTQSDQIRNYILMGLNQEKQTRLYEKYWRGMEKIFGQANYEKYFDDFVRHYLTMQVGTSKSVQKTEVYKAFRRFHEREEQDNERLLSGMHQFARYYSKIALPDQEQDRELSRAFKNLRDLKADISCPLLMYFYHDYERGDLQKSEFLETITMIESYVFRRSVCRYPTSGAGSAMLSMLKEYKNGGTTKMKKRLLGLGGDRLFPWDKMFKTSFISYTKHIKYWPFRLENHFRREPLTDKYTIEHVMPQTLTSQWQGVIGSRWAETRDRCLDLPGNITLTKHNSELGNLSYSDKYNKSEVGYKHTLLKINESLTDTKTWNEKTIDKRSEKLAELAVDCWPRPVIEDT